MQDENEIYIISRTGKRELLDPNKITQRLRNLLNREPKIPHVGATDLMLAVTSSLKSDITTYEIDEYAGNAAASMSISSPYYMKLAARIVIDNHQKNTQRSFLDKMRVIYLNTDSNGKIYPLLSEKFFKYIEQHQDELESYIDYNRDFLFDFFGFRTFQRLYAIKIHNKLVERPQDTFMRVAIALNFDTMLDIKQELLRIKQTYDALSTMKYTQASPTLFNAGLIHNQYASCFLFGIEDDAKGIMDTATNCALTSKRGGGIGIHFHNIRSTGRHIRGTNGPSRGVPAFLKIFDAVMFAYDQGGRRPGSAAIYLMPHHPDIVKFLQMTLPTGDEKERARDLFYALWIPDIFMERIDNDEMWSLFDPDEVGDLSMYHGKEYREKYLKLEKEKKYVKQLPARYIWQLLYEANKIKGSVYICFADAVNKTSMHNNIGTIKSSNLCSEITLYSDHQEYAVCTLASVNLPICIVDTYSADEIADYEARNIDKAEWRPLNHEFPVNPQFDEQRLIEAVKIAVINTNNIIDKNYYPTEESRRGSLRHRPIGIGMQGLADAYLKMRFPYDSAEARELNKFISETMYYAALSQSTRMCRDEYLAIKQQCKEQGHVVVKAYQPDSYEWFNITYQDYEKIPKRVAAYPSIGWNGGSHIGNGKFHWELCEAKVSGKYDWETLRGHILQYGVKNSFVIALMPTASTSAFLGNNECFEPYTSNIYKRTTLAGEYIVINKWLVNDLYKLGLWNESLKNYLLACEGSVQHIDGIPDQIKALYKTAWEIDQKELIDQAADRQPFVDQAQSLNWYLEQVTFGKFTKLARHAWKRGLKTAKYYLHSRPAMPPQKFSIDPDLQAKMQEKVKQVLSKSSLNFLNNDKPVCDLCSA